jgi:hypothetical protein
MENRVTLDVPTLSSFRFSLNLYFFDLDPVQRASAWVFTTSGNISSGCGAAPCVAYAKWLPYGTDRLCEILVPTFAYIELLFD